MLSGRRKVYTPFLLFFPQSSKDHSAFSISRKAIEKDHKDATNVIAQLLVKLRDDASDAADKVTKFRIVGETSVPRDVVLSG